MSAASSEISSAQFSGHETFPLRHGWLTKATNEILKAPSENRGVFLDEDAIVRFGVGKNMVTSIRYWAVSTGIIESIKNNWQLTDIGQYLFGSEGKDRYAESFNTLWLLHWALCSTHKRSTTWYWVFNFLSEDQFDKLELNETIYEFCKEKDFNRASTSTIKNDIDCFLNCYTRKRSKKSVDDIESALVDLNIIQQVKSGSRFIFQKGEKATLHSSVFNYCLYEYFMGLERPSTIAVDKVVHGLGSPGRVFKLGEQAAVGRLVEISETSGGVFEWTETAGLRQVALVREPTSPLELLHAAFEQSND